MSPGSFEAVLEKINESSRPDSIVESAVAPVLAMSPDMTIPQPLRNYLGSGLEETPWKPIGGGAQQYLIPTSDDSQVRLLKIPPSQPVPEHTHSGRELTLVLSGSFTDEAGHFGPGDLEDVDETTTHQPIAGADGPCICLVVTDAPLQFSGLVPRMLQPLIGI